MRGTHPAIIGTERLAETIVPLGELASKIGGLKMAAPLVCGEASSVVKHVVSGLVEVGICDRAALDRWGTLEREGAEPVPLYRTILEIEPTTPTDPILVDARLFAGGENRQLAVELVLGLSEFFNRYPRPAAWAWVDPSSRTFFESWARDERSSVPESDFESTDRAILKKGASEARSSSSTLPGL